MPGVDPSESATATGHPSVPGDGGTEHIGSGVWNGGACADGEDGTAMTPRSTAVAIAASR
jgi:hypothetical protein